MKINFLPVFLCLSISSCGWMEFYGINPKNIEKTQSQPNLPKETSGETEGETTTQAETENSRTLVGGVRVDGTNIGSFALMQFLPDGSFDPSFGIGGMITTPAGFHRTDSPNALLRLSDGRILVGGQSWWNQFPPAMQFTVLRYLSNGELDATFAKGGIAELGGYPNARSNQYLYAMTLQSDQKIVLSGGYYELGRWSYLTARLTAKGVLDTSFGNQGWIVTDVESDIQNCSFICDLSYAVTVQSDGKIVVGGSSPKTGGFTLIRYQPNGALDTSFGNQGIVTTSLGTAAGIRGLRLDGEGNILALGYSPNDYSQLKLGIYSQGGTLISPVEQGPELVKPILTGVVSQSDPDFLSKVKQINTFTTEVSGAPVTFDLGGYSQLSTTFTNGKAAILTTKAIEIPME